MKPKISYETVRKNKTLDKFIEEEDKEEDG